MAPHLDDGARQQMEATWQNIKGKPPAMPALGSAAASAQPAGAMLMVQERKRTQPEDGDEDMEDDDKVLDIDAIPEHVLDDLHVLGGMQGHGGPEGGGSISPEQQAERRTAQRDHLKNLQKEGKHTVLNSIAKYKKGTAKAAAKGA